MKKTIVYLFDARTGVTIKYDSKTEAYKKLGMNNVGTVAKAVDANYLLYGRYKATSNKLKRAEKMAIVEEYWADEELQAQEKWKSKDELLVSNFGRIKNKNGFLFPTLDKNLSIVLCHNKKQYNVVRLVGELFVAKRALGANEIVCRRGGMLEMDANMLYISNWQEYSRKGCRARAREVAKLDAMGEVIEIYESLAEASRANHCSKGGLSMALRDGREFCGMRFKFVEY